MSLPEYVLATFSNILFLAVSANKLSVRNCNSRFSGTHILEEKKSHQSITLTVIYDCL